MPEPYQQLLAICQTLEAHYRDMQDVEFTIQNGQLWVLRSQAGARTSLAAVRIAVEMVESGLIDRDTALIRVDPHRRLNQLLLPSFSLPAFAAESLQQATAEGRRLTAGLVAGPGAATGRIVFSTEDAVAWAKRGEPVILVRHETSPEDISGMAAAAGILTARGGSTSYASLIARQMSKVWVVGCRDINIDYANQQMTIHQHTLRQGDYLSLDGFLGHVYQGHLDTHLAEISQILTEHALDPEDVPNRQIFARLAEWAKEARLR